jgi:hypothetical protein
LPFASGVSNASSRLCPLSTTIQTAISELPQNPRFFVFQCLHSALSSFLISPTVIKALSCESLWQTPNTTPDPTPPFDPTEELLSQAQASPSSQRSFCWILSSGHRWTRSTLAAYIYCPSLAEIPNHQKKLSHPLLGWDLQPRWAHFMSESSLDSYYGFFFHGGQWLVPVHFFFLINMRASPGSRICHVAWVSLHSSSKSDVLRVVSCSLDPGSQDP